MIRMRKFLTLPGLEFVQPVASRYTDFATAVTFLLMIRKYVRNVK
jgi:hypothetical protein